MLTKDIKLIVLNMTIFIRLDHRLIILESDEILELSNIKVD